MKTLSQSKIWNGHSKSASRRYRSGIVKTPSCSARKKPSPIILLARSVSAELTEKTEFPLVNGGTAPVTLVEAMDSASSSDHKEDAGVEDRKGGCSRANIWTVGQSRLDTWFDNGEISPSHSYCRLEMQTQHILHYGQVSGDCNNEKGLSIPHVFAPASLQPPESSHERQPTDMVGNGEFSKTPHLIGLEKTRPASNRTLPSRSVT